MRARTRIALTATAAAAAVALGGTAASAAPPQPPCGDVSLGPCYVSEDGPYTCTIAFVRVGEDEYCLFEWAP